MQLSEHFSYEELIGSDTAVRLGIDNTPPRSVQVYALPVTAQGLERVRHEALHDSPMSVSSGYRCEDLERLFCEKDFLAWSSRAQMAPNDAAWGQYFSHKAHPQGYAADFICPAFGTPDEIVRAIVASKIPFDQLIVEGGGKHWWVHISFAPAMRHEVKTAHFDAEGTPHYSDGVQTVGS